MRKTVSIITVTVFFALVSISGYALAGGVSPVLERIREMKELVVGTAASMPPLNMTTKDGRIIGMEIDLAQLIAKNMEVKLTLKKMNFSELLTALEAGQVDMVLSGMTMTPERNLRVAFVGPYFSSGKSILTKLANAASVDEVRKMNSPDKTLVALKGSTSQAFVEAVMPKAKLVLAEDYDQAVAMVRDDKAIVMVADYPVCKTSVYRYPEAKFVTLEKPISYEPIGIALPPNDPLLLNWLQNYFQLLESSGEMKAMKERWLNETSWISLLP